MIAIHFSKLCKGQKQTCCCRCTTSSVTWIDRAKNRLYNWFWSVALSISINLHYKLKVCYLIQINEQILLCCDEQILQSTSCNAAAGHILVQRNHINWIQSQKRSCLYKFSYLLVWIFFRNLLGVKLCSCFNSQININNYIFQYLLLSTSVLLMCAYFCTMLLTEIGWSCRQ